MRIPLLKIEVARTADKQQIGLMWRRKIASNSGMLFDFGQAKPLSFWMKDTYVPLQIAFLDDRGTIRQIERMSPLSTRSIRSVSSCRFALEVNDGWFDKHQIQIGAQVALPGVQPPATPSIATFPAKDILEAANAHSDLRLILEYETIDGQIPPPQVVVTPFEFIDSKDGDFKAVLRCQTEGPQVQMATEQVAKGGGESPFRSFIIDNILAIRDLKGNPITDPSQIKNVASTQPEKITAVSSFSQWMNRYAQSQYVDGDTYTTMAVISQDKDHYVVYAVIEQDGKTTINIKGRAESLEKAIEMVEVNTSNLVNGYATLPNQQLSTPLTQAIAASLSNPKYSLKVVRQGKSWFLDPKINLDKTSDGGAELVLDKKKADRAKYLAEHDGDGQSQDLLFIQKYWGAFKQVGDRPNNQVYIVDLNNCLVASGLTLGLALGMLEKQLAENTTKAKKLIPQIDFNKKIIYQRMNPDTGSEYVGFESGKAIRSANADFETSVKLLLQVEFPQSDPDMEYMLNDSGLILQQCKACAKTGPRWEWIGKRYEHVCGKKSGPNIVDRTRVQNLLKRTKPKGVTRLLSNEGNFKVYGEQKQVTQ